MSGRFGSIYSETQQVMERAHTVIKVEAMIGYAASREEEINMQPLVCSSWVNYIRMGTNYLNDQIPVYMFDAQYRIVSIGMKNRILEYALMLISTTGAMTLCLHILPIA